MRRNKGMEEESEAPNGNEGEIGHGDISCPGPTPC